MGLKKYRDDQAGKTCENGSVPWFAVWGWGPSLSLVRHCPTPFGPRTVYVRGEADTFFTIPAACEFRKRRIIGYLTSDEKGYTFHPYRSSEHNPYPIVLNS